MIGVHSLATVLALIVAAATADMTSIVVTNVDGRRSFAVAPKLDAESGFAAGEVVYGLYSDKINSTGWAFLEIHGNPDASDADMAYAAGYFEGFMTWERIESHATNLQVSTFTASPALANYFEEQRLFIQAKIAESHVLSPDDLERQLWHQVDLIYTQLDGLFDGYRNASKSSSLLSLQQLTLLSLYWEIADLIDVYGGIMEGPIRSNDHCSALIRLLDNNEDVLIGHNTWTALNFLTRTYKLYDLPFTLAGVAASSSSSSSSSSLPSSSSRVAATSMSFSSYPAALYSADDFYVLSSEMIVLETTIGFNNSELFKYIISESIPEWVRTMASNRIANSGPEWINVFTRYNSGTYNNANMIFDYKRFSPNKLLSQDAFWYSEQAPGHFANNDLSQMLENDRYFGSYNQIFDSELRVISGADELERLYGSYYTYTDTPRAQIFRRNFTNVVDLPSMKSLMRYNDYTKDPLSSQLPFCQYRHWTNCTPPFSAENAISCRDDLNPADGIYAFYDISNKNEAAIDAKITSFSAYNKYSLPSFVISGPTYDPLPVFAWSTSVYNNTPHVGLPDAWEFPWINISW